jgi:CheY-like chemotaxis protein
VLTAPRRAARTQVVNNLVSNALKFTPAGGSVEVRVRVRSHAPAEEGDAAAPPRTLLVLDVADTGCGIAAADLPRLFRPYSQLVSGLQRAGGTGLGLSVCKTLCTRCGGSLVCVSAPGAGSTFTARIPFALGDPLPQPAAAAAAPGPDAAQQQQPLLQLASAPLQRTSICVSVHRVLVADDSAASRMVLVRLLGTMGVAADAVGSGPAAVDAVLGAAAAGAPYTMVFMDKQMPGALDGHGATRALRAAGCAVPVVALTGSALAEDREAFAAAGATAFLAKPATRAELAAVLVAHGGGGGGDGAARA